MTADVLAHVVMGTATLFVAMIASLEATRSIPSERAALFIGTIMTGAGMYHLYILSDFEFWHGLGAFQRMEVAHRQHYMIDFVWIAVGALTLWYRSKYRISILLRCAAMFLVALLLFFHTQPHDLNHAAWLMPYHRIMSSLLIIGVCCYLLDIYKKKHKAALVASTLLAIVGAMLVLYQDPSNLVSMAGH